MELIRGLSGPKNAVHQATMLPSRAAPSLTNDSQSTPSSVPPSTQARSTSVPRSRVHVSAGSTSTTGHYPSVSTLLNAQMEQILESTDGQPYDRNWIANNGVDEEVLTGWTSKHKLDLLVRHGAVVAGDKLRITYHGPQGAVTEEGTVRNNTMPKIELAG